MILLINKINNLYYKELKNNINYFVINNKYDKMIGVISIFCNLVKIILYKKQLNLFGKQNIKFFILNVNNFCYRKLNQIKNKNKYVNWDGKIIIFLNVLNHYLATI